MYVGRLKNLRPMMVQKGHIPTLAGQALQQVGFGRPLVSSIIRSINSLTILSQLLSAASLILNPENAL